MPRRWCKWIGAHRRGIIDQDIKMTLLGFHSLEEGLDLCVICMIAYNGNANSACRRNGLRYFTDRSGSCPRLGGPCPTPHVNRRTLLTKQRCNTCADASARSRDNRDFAGQRRNSLHTTSPPSSLSNNGLQAWDNSRNDR